LFACLLACLLIEYFRRFPWDHPDGILGCVYSFEHLKVASLAIADRQELEYIAQDWQHLVASLAHKVAICEARIQALDEAVVTMVTHSDPTMVANLLVEAEWRCPLAHCDRPHVPETRGGELSLKDIMGEGLPRESRIGAMARGMRCAVLRLQLRWQQELRCLQSTTMYDKHLKQVTLGKVPAVADSLGRLATLLCE
jgi:hypothetical protein